MTTYTNSTVSIETLPHMRVACLRVVSATPEDDGGPRMDRWVAEQGLPADTRGFGFDTDITPEEQKAGMRGYEFWRVVPDHVQPSGDVTIHDFSGGLYATMTLDRCFEIPFERIPGGWKDLHNWVVTNGKYHSAGHQWLEELLHTDYGATLKLYHPVMYAPEMSTETP